MTAGAQARSFGRSAGVLSAGVGAAGLLTYVFFALASHNLDPTAYGEIVVLWSATFVTISVLHRPVEQFISRSVAERRERAEPIGRRCCAPRPGSRRWSRSASRSPRWRCAARSGRPVLRQRRPSTGSTSARCSRSPPASSPAATSPARAGSALLAGLLVSESFSRMAVLARGRGRDRRRAATPSPPGSSPRRCSRSPWSRSPSATARARAGARRRRPPRLRARRDAGLAGGGAFAAAVLLIMLSEQIFLNAGPLLLRAEDGAAAAGYIFNVLMLARAPLLVFQGIAISLLPHLTRLRSRGGDDPARRSAFEALGRGDAAGDRRSSPRVVALVVAIAGPALMQAAFSDRFTYDRAGLLIVTAAMGLYLAATTLNQAALAQGQARRAATCWIACAVGFLVWSLLAGARAGAPDRGRLPRRRRGPLRRPAAPLPRPARRRRARAPARGGRGAASPSPTRPAE